MKTLKIALLLALGFFAAANSAQALEVGDRPSCVDLNQLSPNGTEKEHCLLDSVPTGKPVLLDFFSTTCMYCVENFPQVTNFADAMAGKLTVRAVGIDRDEQMLREFFAANPNFFHYELALDNLRTAKTVYGVVATPTYFLLDAKGIIIFKQVGELEDADFAKIRALTEAQ